jgi:hypothetical protein
MKEFLIVAELAPRADPLPRLGWEVAIRPRCPRCDSPAWLTYLESGPEEGAALQCDTCSYRCEFRGVTVEAIGKAIIRAAAGASN